MCPSSYKLRATAFARKNVNVVQHPYSVRAADPYSALFTFIQISANLKRQQTQQTLALNKMAWSRESLQQTKSRKKLQIFVDRNKNSNHSFQKLTAKS